MATFRVDVEPSLLIWARESLGLSWKEAAKKIGVDELTLRFWEEGAESPTFAQLRDMARVYKRPVAVFYLPSPPKDFLVPRDFRLLPDNLGRPWSPELRAELRRVREQREVALELATLAGDAPPVIDLRIGLDEDPDDVGARIRGWLGVSLEEQSLQERRALRYWVERIEAKGIYVTQVRDVSLGEMRGCSITDRPFPVIALNLEDAPRGKLFTLLHELAHVLLSDGGLCDLDDVMSGSSSDRDRIERFCNRVAASVLVPREALVRHPMVATVHSATEWSDATLDALADRFGASPEAVLRRLVSVGLADWAYYQRRHAEFRRAYGAYREQQRARGGDGGPPHYRKRLSDLGRRYVREVLDAYQRRDINGSELADHLGMKLDHVPALVRYLRTTP